MILALNTSSMQSSVALVRESGSLLGETTVSAGGPGSRPLFPALHELLVRTVSDLSEVGAVAVARGPGSFTGLRVGVATAKGLCQALGVPIIGVSSLEALASQWACRECPTCAVLGARKGEVFAALFRVDESGRPARVTEDTVLRMAELPRFVKGTALFVGDDYDGQGEWLREHLGRSALLAPPRLWAPRASAVAALSLQRLLEGNTDDPAGLVPVYLRAPDIRPNPAPKGVSMPRGSG